MIPIQRLLANLDRKLSQNPNDPITLLHLARLHSFRAGTFTNEVLIYRETEEPKPVELVVTVGPSAVTNATLRIQWQADLTNALAYFERAQEQILRSTNEQHFWLLFPANLGRAWTLELAGRSQDALRQYRGAVKMAAAKQGLGSAKDIPGFVNWPPAARQWIEESESSGFSEASTEETIQQLVKHLSPNRDRGEIARLERLRKRLPKRSRLTSPILIPTDTTTDLSGLVNPTAAVPFDLDGSGLQRRWGWIRTNAAWLVWDPQRTGRITSGLQLFGNVTFWVFWRDGYEALSALDDNGDGKLTGAELAGLALWNDRNSDGVSDFGEVVPAAQAGLLELGCDASVHTTGIPFHPAGARFSGQGFRPTFDWFAPGAAVR